MKKTVIYKISCLLCSILLMSANTNAETYTLTIKVNVLQQTCTVNQNQTITVDFPDMVIKNIDGQRYETSIPYILACDGSANNPALKIKFGGTPAVFNAQYLETSENDLGLEIRINGAATAPERWVDFHFNALPKLTAVPVLKTGGSVNAGVFNASGTLSVEYL